MARLPDGGTGWTQVRLSQVPLAVRQRVAARVIRVEGLVGVPALELMMAAELPIQDPEVTVRSEVARKVVGR